MTPSELTIDEIHEIIEDFAAAARRLQKAGFDGVQLHGAHGYLLAQFLSPLRNQRTDEYGGSLENRARFCLEVYRAVRSAVGPDFPVMIKLNANDFLDGSTTEEDSCLSGGGAGRRGHRRDRGLRRHPGVGQARRRTSQHQETDGRGLLPAPGRGDPTRRAVGPADARRRNAVAGGHGERSSPQARPTISRCRVR